MAQDLSLLGVLLPASIGGVVAAFVNQGLKWYLDAFTEKKSSRADATYLAMRAAVILEAFVSAADAHIRDRAVAHDLHGISDAGKLPKLAEFPTDVVWRTFDSALAAEVLGFPTRIDAAQGEAVRASWECNDHFVTELEAPNLGVAAWDLADRIRKKYGLPANDLLVSTAEVLQKKKAANDARAARYQEKLLADSERAREAVRSGEITPVNQ